MNVRDADRCAVPSDAAAAMGSGSGKSLPVAFRLASVGFASLILANCSQSQKVGSSIDPRYGVAASPRVVAEGEPVPKGGGRHLVGRPYVVGGRTYFPNENPRYAAEGLASWYGSNFHGRLTANGEVFDRYAIAAAHTTMPLPSYARVTNLENGRSIIVRVNDRGPYHGNRVIDVSQQTAEALDFRRKGTARVRVEYVGRASPHGSDDRILLASLRTDGQPATLPSVASTMVAEAQTRSNLPRQALALRSYEPDPDAEGESASTGSGVSRSSKMAVPLPPERPFDLGTIPNAATPVPLASANPSARTPARPLVAGLHFAPAAASGLPAKGSFEPLATKDTVGPTLRR